MYNEFQKQRYLSSPNFRFDDSAKEVIRYMFEGAAEVENQEGLDLAQFNKPQVVRLLKSYNSRSKSYLRTMCNSFSDYYSWCLSEGYVDNTNVSNYYDYTIAKPIIDEVIPLHLLIDKYFLKKDIVKWKDIIYDPVMKFVLYAPFCGVYGADAEDLIYLKIDDIDKENRKVDLKSGITLNIDDLFIELAIRANNATEFYPDGFNRNDNSKKPNQYVYDNSCYILKSCGQMTTDVPVSKGIVMNRFRLIQQILENKFITGSNLYKNGLINYIKEKFEEHGITLKDGIFMEVEKGERQFAGNTYVYSKELQQYINEFGSNMSDRALRLQMKEIIELYK
jgi:hypothetical protein